MVRFDSMTFVLGDYLAPGLRVTWSRIEADRDGSGSSVLWDSCCGGRGAWGIRNPASEERDVDWGEKGGG